MKTDYSFVKDEFYDYLKRGNPSVLTTENIGRLNSIAFNLYNTPNDIMSDEDIDCLRIIIMICNLTYNRTDMQVLPIEDGIYDLLLEKYRIFDSNFQVGSAIVDFRSTMETKENNFRTPVCPIVFLDKNEPKDNISRSIRSDIMMENQPIMDFIDLNKPAITFNNDVISKRTHTTEHSHPTLIGTLDKSKFVLMSDAENAGVENDTNVKILERDFFHKHLEKGIITPNQHLTMVLELKYDGVSVEADCSNIVKSARTRGDTGIGVAADITPILQGYLFKHAKSFEYANIGIKFEAIMTRSNLYNFNIARNYSYSNCRTAIIGLFGASDAYLFRDYITLIPLAIDRNDMRCITNRIEEINFLNMYYRSNGEPLRYCIIEGNYVECLFQIKRFLEEAKAIKPILDFMYDGIVVSYVDPYICEKLGRENFINKYSMAVKFDAMRKTTTFRGYTYEVGQNGAITPMLHYDPVEFYGTIHTKCSGASFARFKELSLKYGDHIDVTYVNDVMPYVTKTNDYYNEQNTNPIIEPPTQCPMCGSYLVQSDSGKMLLCQNFECGGRKVSRVANMLSKMNLKGFGDSMITAIDKYNLRDIINLDSAYLAPRIGDGNAANFVKLMDDFKSKPIYDYEVIGSLGFTSIASKKWKNIFKQTTIDGLIGLFESGRLLEFLIGIEGIGETTAITICSELKLFMDDIKYIMNNMHNVRSYHDSISSSSVQKQIRFSGCRDLQLEEQLRNAGYDADSSGVTKQTDILLVPYKGYTSSKTKKLSSKGIIVPIREFKENLQFYLG